MKRMASVLVFAALGCRPADVRPSAEAPSGPDRWILVDRPFSEVGPLAQAGCAQVLGSGRAWVLEPVYDSRPSPFPHGLRILYSRPRRYEVDELVEIDVAVEGCDAQGHVIEIVPTKRMIELLTPPRFEVAPSGRATIRFVAGSPGPGGVTIRVARCGMSEIRDAQ
jgi:hypothetical protein